tara:strand:+ start:23 stop:1891 length:1869 start_codon:yes stop_codon:yes gene_type:complete
MKNSIIFLEGDVDKKLINKITNNFTSPQIFTLDYTSHKKLESLSISHNLSDDELSDSDKKEIDMIVTNLASNWYKKFENNLSFHDIPLPTMIETEMVLFLSSLYIKIFSIDKILKKFNTNYVLSSSVVNDYIKKQCILLDLPCEIIEIIKDNELLFDKINLKFNILNFPMSINISRKNFLKIKEIFEKILYGIVKTDLTSLNNQKSIVLLDFNTVQYDQLFHELSTLDKNVILINQRRPAIWNWKSLQIIRNSKLKVFNLNKFQKQYQKLINESIRDFKTNIDNMFDNESYLENLFSINEISFWNSIQTSFKKICYSRFSESITRIILFEKFFTNFKTSVILEWAETGQEEKDCLYVSKNFNIPSIMLQHARMPISPMWKPYGKFLGYFSDPLLSTKQAVWGDSTQNYAVSCGHKKENVIITGSPRHDKFFNYRAKSKKKGIILFATTGWAGVATETSTVRSMIQFENFVKTVFDVMKKFPDKQLIIKPHPHSENLVNALAIFKKLDPTIQVLPNANLTELIDSSEIVITFTNSTIALESIILGKPTMSLQIENWAKDEEIAKMNAVYSIYNENEIEEGIKKLLYDEDFKKELQINAKIFLNQYLKFPGKSSKKLADELNNF